MKNLGWFIFQGRHGERLGHRCACRTEFLFDKPELGARVFCCGSLKVYEHPTGWLARFADELPRETFETQRKALALSWS